MMQSKNYEDFNERIQPDQREMGERVLEVMNNTVTSSRRSTGEGEGQERPRELKRRIGEKVLKSTPFVSTQLKIDDFKDLYPESKLHRDERYAADLRHTLGIYEHLDDAAKVFERLFIDGIQVNRWLGNTGRHQASGVADFTTQTFSTTEYDDLRHRVDVFSVLAFDKPLENDAGIKFRMLPMSFDLTLDGNRNKVLDKLMRSCNDNEALPFGFTHIDYFTDGKRVMNCPIIPRYVVGLSDKEIGIIERQNHNPNMSAYRMPLTKQNLRLRFKVLSEIRAQNELFEAMLPEDAYENPSSKVRIAQACIEAADSQLTQALAACADDMVKYRAVPDWLLEKIAQNPLRTRSLIEDFLINEGQKYYNENQSYQRYKRKDDARHPLYNDVFVQIMTQVRDLTAAARKNGSKRFPWIRELKTEQPRNRKFFMMNNTKNGSSGEDS